MPDESGFAEASGEDGSEQAVVVADEQEAAGVETGGGASIAGGRLIWRGVAGFDADALAGEPGGVLGQVVLC